MPRGPFGFPRLTTLGPFVEPDKIRPNHDTSPGVYPLEFIETVQPKTALDTAMFLSEGQFGVDFPLNGAEFEYKQVVLGELLEDSEFSGTLIEFVEQDPDEVQDLIETREIDKDKAEDLCAVLQWSDEQREWKECGRKVKDDIKRVLDINNSIRSSREYFPPTIFPINSSFGDTIDGAHRIVALASILNTEEMIWVWEIVDPEAVFKDLEEFGII